MAEAGQGLLVQGGQCLERVEQAAGEVAQALAERLGGGARLQGEGVADLRLLGHLREGRLQLAHLLGQEKVGLFLLDPPLEAPRVLWSGVSSCSP